MSGVISSPGALAVENIYTGYYPQEGSRSVTAIYNWTNILRYVEDLSYLLQDQGRMQTIQAVFIDNSQSAGTVTIKLAGTGQTMMVPANCQAILPAFFASGARYTITCSTVNPNNTTLIWLNIPCPGAMIWSVLNAGGGTNLAPLIAIEQPYQNEIPMVLDTDQAAQRAIKILAVGAGTVSFVYLGGATGSLMVNAGTTIFTGAITKINSAGTTASATYANLV